jgi:DNA primase catalytic subunit
MEKEKRQAKGNVFINLDRKRVLKYSRDSYQEILRYLQISRGNSELMERKLNGLDLRYLSVFLWAGLNWEDPLLHLVKVENMLVQYENNLDKLKELESAVVKALKIAVKSREQQPGN